MDVESHAGKSPETRIKDILSTTKEKGNFFSQVRLNRGEKFLGHTERDGGYMVKVPDNSTVSPFFEGKNSNGSIISAISRKLAETRDSGFSTDSKFNENVLQLIHMANADGSGTSLLSITYKNQKPDALGRVGKSFFSFALQAEDAQYLVAEFTKNPNETLDKTLTSLDPNSLTVTPHGDITDLQTARIEIPQGKDITSVDPETVTPRG